MIMKVFSVYKRTEQIIKRGNENDE